MRTLFSTLSISLLLCQSVFGAYMVEAPAELQHTCEAFLADQPSRSGKDTADALRKHLVDKGYTFAQVSIGFKNNRNILVVKEGKIGKATYTGNQFLSSAGISEYINWKEGDSFNFGRFQKSTATLNRKKFVEVDTKLTPVRGEDGEILVNADFSVDDTIPLTGSINVRGDSAFVDNYRNNYRSTLSLEYWEPFFSTDRIGLSVSTDPDTPSELLSASLNYKFRPKEYSQVIYGGYSDSDKDLGPDSLPEASLPFSSFISPDSQTFYVGYQGFYGLPIPFIKDISLLYGATYLDTTQKSQLFAGDKKLALILPRIGLRGSFKNPSFSGHGNNFWSVTYTHDVDTDQADLVDRSDYAGNNFYYIDLHFSTYQPLFINTTSLGGLLARINGRFTDGLIPQMVRYRVGGGFPGTGTVRGYTEGEFVGDRGFTLNFEYRYREVEFALGGLNLHIQPFIFYDFGYIENLDSSFNGTFLNESSDLQSVGLGINGNLLTDLDFSLTAGAPMVDGFEGESGLKSEKWQPRVNLDLSWKF